MAKDKDQLIDSRVSESQCKKAVDALHDWTSKKATKDAENELLPGKEPAIWLCVAVKQSPSGMSFKPVRIPIVHPIVDPRTNNVCLLTKDPQREYKDLLESHDIKFISRVVGLAKLKGKFNAFEARRALLKENGLFLADQSIIPLLPKLLGNKWFAAKKQPIPVCMTRKDLKAELVRAINSTYMNQNKGTSISIKIGTLSQKPSQILANLKSAIPAVASHIKGGEAGWENIQSLGIKTNSSVYLPIWSCALDDAEGGRWAGLTVADEGDGDIEMGGDEEESGDEPPVPEKKPVAKAVVEKGKKKRSAEDDDEVAPETAKPKKKAKSQDSPTVPEAAPAQPKKRKTAEVPEPTPAAVDEKSSKKRRKSDFTATPTAPIVSEATTEVTTPKKSKKKADVVAAPTAMEVDPTPATVTPPTETKSKKKKKADAGAAAEPADLPDTDATLSQSKKKKKAAADLPEEPPATAAVLAEAPKTEEKKKKRKDRKSVSAEDAPVSESLPHPAPAPTTLDEATPTKKSRKEKRKSISSAETAPEPVVEVTKEVEVEEAVVEGGASEEKTEKKKRRKVKKTAQAKVDVEEIVAIPEQASILNKQEMKQKKAASAVGGRKKEKVVKSKAGKSAKDALLGKKAAQ
ncbi:proteasome-interacting protein cic1 [Marasmius tenuissimus]|uniref:Proteasome-interacting protein cic1 n=1 Tax=Marasmius tenuissimus TaxID=585030 RepID=A0ABR2ZXV1_9AGAR